MHFASSLFCFSKIWAKTFLFHASRAAPLLAVFTHLMRWRKLRISAGSPLRTSNSRQFRFRFRPRQENKFTWKSSPISDFTTFMRKRGSLQYGSFQRRKNSLTVCFNRDCFLVLSFPQQSIAGFAHQKLAPDFSHLPLKSLHWFLNVESGFTCDLKTLSKYKCHFLSVILSLG